MLCSEIRNLIVINNGYPFNKDFQKGNIQSLNTFYNKAEI